MKILFTLSPAFNPNDGGVQRTTFKLGQYFTRQGLDVSYFSLAQTGHIVPEYGRLYHGRKKGKEKEPTNLAYLTEVLRDIQPDIVINQMPYLQPLTEMLWQGQQEHAYLLIGCLRNSLFSVKNNIREKSREALPVGIFRWLDHPPGLALLLHLHRIKHRRQLRRILDKHDRYVLLAPPNREELAYFVGDYQAQKVDCIPNSIPAIYPDDSAKEKVLLHVGRLNIPQKRSDLLLEVWSRIHAQLPDWKFVIVGDGPYREKMKARIEREQLPRVEMTGYQKPEPYYRAANIFLMTSAYEGFPNVILEAQSYGNVPVVYASYPAISWIVNQRKDAVLIEPYDVSAMAEEVVGLAQKEQRLQDMRGQALANAEQFTIERVGRKWLAYFAEHRK